MSANCFYCEGHTRYHPTCEEPGCSADVHGHGPEGKRVYNYCPKHMTGASEGSTA